MLQGTFDNITFVRSAKYGDHLRAKFPDREKTRAETRHRIYRDHVTDRRAVVAPGAAGDGFRGDSPLTIHD
jgi:hypothetical protein